MIGSHIHVTVYVRSRKAIEQKTCGVRKVFLYYFVLCQGAYGVLASVDFVKKRDAYGGQELAARCEVPPPVDGNWFPENRS